MRPVQAATVAGSHTSNLISESDDGLAVPCTRHRGTVSATPLIVAGGVTIVADVIVDGSGVTDVNCAQVKAASLAPDAAVIPSASASLMLPVLVTCMISPVVWLLLGPHSRPKAT
jgi:hypothetical protein